MQVRKIRSILIDDDSDNNEVLELMLNHSCDQIEVVAKCNSVNKAIEQIQLHQPDLIFLDIEMPVKDGFQLLKVFEKASFSVIVVTSYQQYALKAIKYAAIDYILKPVEIDELVLAVKKVEETLFRKDHRLEALARFFEQNQRTINKIIIPSTNGFSTIFLSNIVSINAESGNYSLFKLTNENSKLVTKPLSYFEELLPTSQFFRIHRSYMVNLEKIKAFDRSIGKLTLDNGESLEVAFRRRTDFYRKFKNSLGK